MADLNVQIRTLEVAYTASTATTAIAIAAPSNQPHQNQGHRGLRQGHVQHGHPCQDRAAQGRQPGQRHGRNRGQHHAGHRFRRDAAGNRLRQLHSRTHLHYGRDHACVGSATSDGLDRVLPHARRDQDQGRRRLCGAGDLRRQGETMSVNVIYEECSGVRGDDLCSGSQGWYLRRSPLFTPVPASATAPSSAPIVKPAVIISSSPRPHRGLVRIGRRQRTQPVAILSAKVVFSSRRYPGLVTITRPWSRAQKVVLPVQLIVATPHYRGTVIIGQPVRGAQHVMPPLLQAGLPRPRTAAW